MRDGVHQMRLTEAGAAGDEQRVVARATAASRGEGRSVRQLIRGTDHEVREGVLWVERGGELSA